MNKSEINHKKKKTQKKDYAKILHNDAKIILILLIIASIFDMIFQASSYYDYLILMILYIISICYNKSIKKKSLGIIMIVAAVILIFESIIDFSSLFNLIFLFLGGFSIYHSICYLKNIIRR